MIMYSLEIWLLLTKSLKGKLVNYVRYSVVYV